MKVSEAIDSRRSVRAFLERPVDAEVMRRVLTRAARAPSGGNLQPWKLFVLTGHELARFKTTIATRITELPEGEGTEYDVYPKALASPYAERRYAVGEAMYAQLGITREDRAARRSWFNRNYRFFDAPVGLFCFVERYMGPPQWSDLGMYLQSLMLLLREEGLDSCPQECWALYAKTIADFLSTPPELMLFSGMSIGYADSQHVVNQFSSARAPLEEFARFCGFAE